MAAAESPSVADTRWRVAAAPSVPLADGTPDGAPGHPVFDIELLRRRAGPAGVTWRVEWNRERRAFQDPDERGATWRCTSRGCRLSGCGSRGRMCSPAVPDVPYAVIEKVKGAQRLYAVDPEAARLGIEPGMTLADARARVAELEAFDHVPHDDHVWLERLADGCARYTPWVMLDAPDGLVLDVTGCVHLFAGETALAADAVARLGAARRGGAAMPLPTIPTRRARWRGIAAPARARTKRSGACRWRRWGSMSEATLALKRAGLKTVGDVVVRPLSAIAARFGERAATRVRRIIGEADSPLSPRIVKPPLYVERRFAEPVARTEFALEVLGELMAEAVARLEETP